MANEGQYLAWVKEHGWQVTLAQILDSKVWAAEYRKHHSNLRKEPYNLDVTVRLNPKEPGKNLYTFKPKETESEPVNEIPFLEPKKPFYDKNGNGVFAFG